MGAVVMVLALKHPLSEQGYYWYIPRSAGFPFLALVEHTNFVPPEHFGGDRIVYTGYLGQTTNIFSSARSSCWSASCPAWRLARSSSPTGCAKPGCSASLCPAGAAGKPLENIPPSRRPSRTVFRQHEPGLPMGPGNELPWRLAAVRPT